jgi:hypothetical protein
MIETIAVFSALVLVLAAGLFIAACCRRVGGVDGHVKIGDTWYEIDGHGRVIYRAEESK